MILPKSILLDHEGQYCLKCFSGPIQRIKKKNRTYYQCNSCGTISARSLVIDNKILWEVDATRKYWHHSVGVIVQDGRGRILTFLRQLFPFAYTIPSGHIDGGEEPLVAAERELLEETGLSSQLELIARFDLSGDSCRRGCDDHHWHLYTCTFPETPRVIISDEAEKFEWLSMEEIQKKNNRSFPLDFIVRAFKDKLDNASLGNR